MGKVSVLHEADSLAMPLADGATLRVTPFRETPCVAVTLHGPGGGDAGGALLSARRARLLASWLLRLADQCGNPAGAPRTARMSRGRIALHRPVSRRD